MSDDVEDLYDYVEVRALDAPTMFVVETNHRMAVLGGSQSADVVDRELLGDMKLRRRRGGGGLVLLQPGDVWVDWWIPAGDPRWSHDVHSSSMMVGDWWREALCPLVAGNVEVHDRNLEGDVDIRVICFAGRGPGEVFVNGRKAVGLTQWRVREGIFASTLLPSGDSLPLIGILKSVPDGLALMADHHRLDTLGISDPQILIDTLQRVSGEWQIRTLHLIP